VRYGKFGLLVVAAATAAASAGLLVSAGGAAVAAGGGGPTPPWISTETVQPEGFVTFYNAQGQVVTGGNLTDPTMAAYAVASAPDTRTGDFKAALFAYTPVAGENPLLWSGQEITLATAYPNASAPGAIATTANPVVSGGADVDLAQYVSNIPNTQTASGYPGLYDIRLETSGIGQPDNPDYFYETVISVDTSTGTWSVDYPDYTQNTTTTVTASPSTETTPGPITLTATVSPTADSAGTVSFWTGYGTSSPTQVGTTQTVSSSGTASVTATPATGTTGYTAVYTPPIGSADIGSTGSLSYFVGVGATSTTTTLAGSPGPSSPVSQGSSVMLTATEVAADSTNPAGNVQFFQGTTSLGTQAVNSSGVAVLPTTALKPTGPTGAAVTATFTPTSTSYSPSTSNTLTYTVNPVAVTPTLSGPHQVGQKETCSEGTLDTGVTASYTWLAGTTKVGTGATLTVPASAYNKELTCQVTVQDDGGTVSAPATSAAAKVALGKALTATKKPTLSGSHKVGKTERVKPGTWSQKGVTFSYQWLLNGKVIKHATKSTFKPSKSDKGKKLSCRVTAHLTGYASGSATTSSVKISS